MAWQGGIEKGKMSVRGEAGWEGWLSMIKANDQSFCCYEFFELGLVSCDR